MGKMKRLRVNDFIEIYHNYVTLREINAKVDKLKLRLEDQEEVWVEMGEDVLRICFTRDETDKEMEARKARNKLERARIQKFREGRLATEYAQYERLKAKFDGKNDVK
jgi:hypothetical protein